jgi:hypothetical protein
MQVYSLYKLNKMIKQQKFDFKMEFIQFHLKKMDT